MNNLALLGLEAGFSVKGKQFLLRYDNDLGTINILRQRYFFTPGTTEVFTPITPTIAERISPLIPNSGVPTSLPYQPRTITACFVNPQVTQGFSEYAVFIPYTANDDRFRQSLTEIRDLENVGATSYQGETHTLGVRRYVSQTD